MLLSFDNIILLKLLRVKRKLLIVNYFIKKSVDICSKVRDNKHAAKRVIEGGGNEMNVPNEILKQLGGNRFLAMTGAKNLVGDGNTLRMKLPRNGSKANSLWITLDEGKELYSMRFFKYTPGRLDIKTGKFIEDKVTNEVVYQDVYFDMLQDIFTQHTKMYTCL